MTAGLDSRRRAVVFDLDGTLIDTAPEFVAIAQRLRQEQGLPVIEEASIYSAVSDGAAGMVTAALDLDPGSTEHEAQRLRFLELYETCLGEASRPYPGLADLVSDLARAGIAWGVATNKMRRFAEPLMAVMGFEPPVMSLVTPCDVTHAKPHPEALLLSCRQLEVHPHNTIYVGDHKRDIDAGRTAGCKTIAAAYGYLQDEEDPHAWQADEVVASSLDLARCLRERLL